MRGILIDPFTRSVSEVETDGSLMDIYRLLEVEVITAVSVGEDQTLFLDDEGLLVPKEQQEFWQWRGSNQPYAGRGLILGVDEEGENVDSTMGFWDANMRVAFLDKEAIDPEAFLGFSVMVMP